MSNLLKLWARYNKVVLVSRRLRSRSYQSFPLICLTFVHFYVRVIVQQQDEDSKQVTDDSKAVGSLNDSERGV